MLNVFLIIASFSFFMVTAFYWAHETSVTFNAAIKFFSLAMGVWGVILLVLHW